MPETKNGAIEADPAPGQGYTRQPRAVRLASNHGAIYPVRRSLPASDLIGRTGPLAILSFWVFALALAQPPNLVDHHQHLLSPQSLSVFSPLKPITAADLIAQMDVAGIDRAVVLSDAYGFSNPFKNPGPDEYAHVRAENDWVSTQVGMYPQRLIGFCSVNPLRDYALREIDRCSRDPNLQTGLKLHFGNSDVNLDIDEHVERTKAVFAAANGHGMSIVVHAHANIDHNRPYGANQARAFLERLLPAAPDITVQIAHLAGGGGYDRTRRGPRRICRRIQTRRFPRTASLL